MNAYPPSQSAPPPPPPGGPTEPAPTPPTYHLVPIALNGPGSVGAGGPPPPPHAGGPPPPQGYPIAMHLPPGYQLVPGLPPPPPPHDEQREGGGGAPAYYASAADLYSHVQAAGGRAASPVSEEGGIGANHYPSASQTSPSAAHASAAGSSSGAGGGAGARLPPILQVEKAQVTTNATQVASASRRRNDANFECPVPGCGSTFTRRFNLRGHLRSHTEERPYLCPWPGCGKGFARQHDCKRHHGLHTSKSAGNTCRGCSKSFSRLDALNRHLRSDTGIECRGIHEAVMSGRLVPALSPPQPPQDLPMPQQSMEKQTA